MDFFLWGIKEGQFLSLFGRFGALWELGDGDRAGWLLVSIAFLVGSMLGQRAPWEAVRGPGGKIGWKLCSALGKFDFLASGGGGIAAGANY